MNSSYTSSCIEERREYRFIRILYIMRYQLSHVLFLHSHKLSFVDDIETIKINSLNVTRVTTFLDGYSPLNRND